MKISKSTNTKKTIRRKLSRRLPPILSHPSEKPIDRSASIVTSDMLKGYAIGNAHSGCRPIIEWRKESYDFIRAWFLRLRAHALRCSKTSKEDREFLKTIVVPEKP